MLVFYQLTDGSHYKLNYLIQHLNLCKNFLKELYIPCSLSMNLVSELSDAYHEGFLGTEVNKVRVEQHQRLENLSGILFAF